MIANRIPKRLLPWLSAFCLATSTPLLADTENVCRDKHWLDSPVIALTVSARDERDDGESGIGGTGSSENPVPDRLAYRDDEDGIGGTGIVGMISGFGSLCIAGQEVFYDQQTPVVVNGQPASYQVFGLGQMVSIRAKAVDAEDRDKGFVATEIQVLHEVSGVVESVAEDQRTFSVLGQKIHLTEQATADIHQGQQVAVSGYRLPDGIIQVTRLERGADGVSSLIGRVDAVDDQGMIVSGQMMRLADGQVKPIQGSEIRVDAKIDRDKGEWIAHAWQDNPRLMFSAPVERVWVQGHIRAVEDKEINIDGVKVRLDHAGHPDHHPQEGERVNLEMPVPRYNDSHRPTQPHIMRPDVMKPDVMKPDVMKPDVPRIDHDRIHILRQERFDLWRELPHKPDFPERPPREHR